MDALCDKDMQINIYDQQGKLIASDEIYAAVLGQIDISTWPVGTYATVLAIPTTVQ